VGRSQVRQAWVSLDYRRTARLPWPTSALRFRILLHSQRAQCCLSGYDDGYPTARGRMFLACAKSVRNHGGRIAADQKEICVRRHERVAPEIIRSAAKYSGPWPDARDNVARPDPLQICWRAADFQPPGGLARSQALRGTDE
jgi:hypothetical protein